jgi:hypothetical protein
VERSVIRALAKVPADRFPTAAAFTEALTTPRETAVTRTPTPPVPATPTARAPAPPHRRRWVFALAAGVVGLALAAGYLWCPRPKTALDPNLVAVVPFRVKGAAPELGYLREGMIDLVAARLTGEGSARAADPRSLMDAWRRTAGSETDDLPEGAVIALARRLGAAHAVLEEPVRAVRELTGGGAHVSIDTAGLATTCRDSVLSLRTRGRHVQMGHTVKAERGVVALPIDIMMVRELAVLSAFGMAAHRFDTMLTMIETGKLAPGRIVSETVPLTGAGDVLAAMADYGTQGVVVIDVTAG